MEQTLKSIEEILLQTEARKNPELKALLEEKEKLFTNYPELVKYDKYINNQMKDIKSPELRMLYLAETLKELAAVMLSTISTLDDMRSFTIRG
jgi:hypothetical protein